MDGQVKDKKPKLKGRLGRLRKKMSFKSIFSKQIAIYSTVLVLAFTALGLVLSNIFSDYVVQQKIETLTLQCQRIAQSLRQYGYFLDLSSQERFQEDMSMLDYLGASYLISDEQGNIILGGEGTIEGEIIEYIQSGKSVQNISDFGGIYDESMLTIGYPIIVNNSIWGAIFVSTPMSEVYSSTNSMVQMTVLCLIVSLLILLLITYIASRTITRPLRKVTEAAKEIADGDFEKRLEVESQDEVGQLAESFNNMTESLENIENNRREFIANISHDLRSPLTSMQGFLQAMIDGTVPPERQERYLGIVLDETQRLTKMTNDILDLSKLQKLDLEITPTTFDVNALIREIVLRFESRVLEKNIALNISFADEADTITADRDKVERIIYNLLDNAVKFTNQDGHINVSTRREKGRVWMRIEDDGRGISEEEQKRIFDRFYKADASRGEHKKGSGLGLSIVKEFVKAHGENITVNSVAGQGCTFEFSMRLAEEEGGIL